MTPEEMRELDALLAEKVFGMSRPPSTANPASDPDGPDDMWTWDGEWQPLPISSDPSAMLSLLDKLREPTEERPHGWLVTIRSLVFEEDRYEVSLRWDRRFYVAKAPTLQLAVALAAKKTVEESR